MKLDALYQELALGELQNLSIVNEDTGELKDERAKKRVLNLVNEGLLKLYTRFTLREEILILRLQQGQEIYRLDKEDAIERYEPSAFRQAYIIDYGTRFRDDLIRIIDVTNQCGTRLPLNNEIDSRSVFTPFPTTLQVPCATEGALLSVSYQARHPVVDGVIDEGFIELPDTLEVALRSYIAFKIYSYVNTEVAKAAAQNFYSIYEATCNEIEKEDLVNNTRSNTNTRFQSGGWI